MPGAAGGVRSLSRRTALEPFHSIYEPELFDTSATIHTSDIFGCGRDVGFIFIKTEIGSIVATGNNI
jgi:hypothetical protein